MVDAVQATLGEALLLLGGLAAVLGALILLLLEAKVILRLGGQLNRELRFVAPPPVRPPPTSTDQLAPESTPEQERRNNAAR